MPRSYSQGAVFADNFMRGFSFVDDIKRKNRAEKRLDERLAAEADERAFQRERTMEADKNVREDRQYTRGERARIEEERTKREEGERIALDPESTADELMPYAAFSPSAKARLQKIMGREEFAKAFEGAQTIPGAPGSTQSNVVTSGQGNPSLSDLVTNTAAGTQPQVDPTSAEAAAGNVANQAATLFQPSRGMSGVEQVSEEDIAAFDPEYQNKGFGARIGDVVGGQAQQITRGFGNIAEAAIGGSHPAGSASREVMAPGPRAAGAAFAGDTFVPEEFVSKAEYDQIADPQKRADVAARNAEIINEQKAKARNPSRNKLARPITRQGAVQEGGELLRDQVQREQNRIHQVYAEFLEGSGGALETAALEEPSVVAVDYFENRATLSEVDPGMVEAVDRRMVPVLDAYAAEVQGELMSVPSGSAEYRQLQSKMKSILASRDQIAADQPPAAQRAGVNASGLKIGDTARVQSVVAAIYDPESPSYSAVPRGQLNSAITTASRIRPNKRLNANQIESLAVLAEAGYIDKPTMLSIGMTGHWPPGKNPGEIRKTFKSGSTTWAQTEGGQLFMLPDPIGAQTRAKDEGTDNRRDRSLDKAAIEATLMGAATAGVSEERNGQVIGLMSDHAGWIRKHYNTGNQESMIAAGRAIGQAVFLSGAKAKQMGDDYNPFTNPKNAPTAEEIFLNPVMRQTLAEEFGSKPVPMPAVGNRSDLDLEQFKAGLYEGAYGLNIPEEHINNMTEDDLLYVYWVLNAEAEDIAAANGE